MTSSLPPKRRTKPPMRTHHLVPWGDGKRVAIMAFPGTSFFASKLAQGLLARKLSPWCHNLQLRLGIAPNPTLGFVLGHQQHYVGTLSAKL
jgi:hypothetical protein